jgi:pyridoxal phosphate enzyme (YggS family)
MSIVQNITQLKSKIPARVSLVAVSKTHPVNLIQEVYDTGQRIFGENRVQELVSKHTDLPADIEWHLIGHLQTNKVKDIAPFISLIHSIDSFKLLEEVNKQARKNNRVIDCLLQVYIAKEETKFGMDFEEVSFLLTSEALQQLKYIRICGLMGMATNTADMDQVRKEFRSLKTFFDSCSFPAPSHPNHASLKVVKPVLSMGMSSDYQLAIEEGSTMIRVGSAIFGSR